MSDYDPNIKEISGPVNVVRLEGTVDGVKKVIYLFMDFHMPPFLQTECTNIFSKDVNKYFADEFYKLKNTSKTYDFFLEIRPTEELIDSKQIEDKQKLKMIYISQVMKLFSKIFKYDKATKKVGTPDVFKNVRLHYLDIRDYFYENIFYKLREVVSMATYFVHINNAVPQMLQQMVNIYLNPVKQNLQIVVDALTIKFYEAPKEKPVYIKKQEDPNVTDVEMVKRLANKIRNQYNNKETRKILNDYINNLVDSFTNLIKYIDENIQLFTKISNDLPTMYGKLTWNDFTRSYGYGIPQNLMKKIIDIITDSCIRMDFEALDLFARLTDIYFMRRFLDKDYITNAIAYSGAFHSIDYINMLVKDFGFEITHAAYSKINGMKELTNEVKKLKDTEIEILFYPPELYQCSNLTNFPDNFL